MKTLSAILIFFCVSLVSAAEPAGEPDASTPSTTEPSTEPATKSIDADGHCIWFFTAYLKGTTPQVLSLLNGEVDRLRELRASSYADVMDRLKDIAPRQKRVVQQLHQSAEYQDLANQLKATELEKQHQDGQERAEATQKIAKLRAGLQMMEHEAIWGDRALNGELTSIRSAEEELRRHTQALEKAEAWRDKQVAVIYNTFAFKYPPKPGADGALYDVYPTKLLPNKDVTARVHLLEWTGRHVRSAGDGMQTEDSVDHPMHFVLSGINGAVVGKELDANGMFHIVKITNVSDDPDKGVYYAQRVKDDADELLPAVLFSTGAPKPMPPPLP